jgi:hypothetical protein
MVFGTVPKSNRKIVERDKIDTSNTQMHDRSFHLLGTGTSIKSGVVKLVLRDKTIFVVERYIKDTF